MKPLFRSLLILLVLPACFCFAQPYQVGHLQQTFIDSSRSNRNIPSEIYYPAATAGNNVPVEQGPFPVLIFGHGFVMTWSAYDVIWNALVPNGYIMVFPTTESSFSPSHSEFGKDIAFLTVSMEHEGANASSPFYNAVSGYSAAMGHSMGGGSSFLAVQYDTTIDALVTLAAANTTPSSISAASSSTIPALVFSGSNDCVAPPSQHQEPMYDSLASVCKTFISITGGSHCQFANYNVNCYFGEGTCTPQATITPVEQQTILFDLMLPWLDYYLKSDCQAGTQFQNMVTTGIGITSQQNCALVCTGAGELQGSPLHEIFFGNNVMLFLFNSCGQLVMQMNYYANPEMILKSGSLPDGIYYYFLSADGRILDSDVVFLNR